MEGRDMALALVTGTSSGIGLATAVALARAGHTVVATMRNLDGGAK
jgi:NAD(P)-dependent dehydrogenase (short-subunit alcohol dehydrogenase family)